MRRVIGVFFLLSILILPKSIYAQTVYDTTSPLTIPGNSQPYSLNFPTGVIPSTATVSLELRVTSSISPDNRDFIMCGAGSSYPFTTGSFTSLPRTFTADVSSCVRNQDLSTGNRLCTTNAWNMGSCAGFFYGLSATNTVLEYARLNVTLAGSPTVTTQAVTSIASTTAVGNGTLSGLGTSNPSQFGHVWSTSQSPTTSNSKTQLGATSTTGAFTSNLTGLSASTTYYVRSYATNLVGTVYGSEVSFITLSAPPTVQASGLATTSVDYQQLGLSWSNGNGGSRIVFMRAGTTTDPVPVSATTYTANSSFGSGSQIGSTGWYAVYKGSGTSVTVTNLTPGVEYRIVVFDFTGSTGGETYLSSISSGNALNASTQAYVAPTSAATNLTAGLISATASTIGWTNGNGSGRIVFIKEGSSGSAAPVDGTTYTANSVFGSGSQIGSTGWYAVYKGTGTSVSVSRLDATKAYRIHVVEYNGIAAAEKYQTADATNNPITKTVYAGSSIYSNYSTGNDSTGNGSSGSPYKTFHKAYTMAVDGDTLDLTGTFSWNNVDETGDATTNGYTLNKSLAIVGHGAGTTTIQAHTSEKTASARLFSIGSYATTTFENITMRHGNVGANGICIYNNSTSVLTLRNVQLTKCNMPSGAVAGGAIYNNGGTVNVENSSLDQISNTANIAAAYYTNGGISTFTNVTFSGNSVPNTSTYAGSALYIAGGTTRLTNVTITANQGNRGAVYLGSGTLLVRNSIIAGNTAASGQESIADIYRVGGTLTNGGYNIFGRHTTSYPTYTTGDWNDSDGDGTYALYSIGTTGSLSLSATSTASNGTVVAAIDANSIAVDRATTTAHGSVAIPSSDQSGRSRGVAPDIGAYEYGALADTTPPIVSNIASSTTATTATITWTTNETSDSQVEYGLTTGYGSSVSSPSSVTNHSIDLSDLEPSTVYHFRISSTDAAANATTTGDYTFTTAAPPANVTPVSLSTIVSATSTVVTWLTSSPASSRVYFGMASGNYASSTPEMDSLSRVTSHAVTLPGLPVCTRVYYFVVSRGSGGESATSSPTTFTTRGCTGGAVVETSQEGAISVSTGGSLNNGTLSLSVPTGFTSATTSAIFQAHSIDKTSFFASAGIPSGKARADTEVFNLKAFATPTSTVSSFSSALDVTLEYDDSSISGLDESTLWMYRYDGNSWYPLSNCEVDMDADVVTCQTSAFSDFALFGDELPVNNFASTETTQTPRTSKGASIKNRVANLVAMGNTQAADALKKEWSGLYAEQNTASSSAVTISVRDLSFGMSGDDVRNLQKILNSLGFMVAVSGPGSINNETTYFGVATRRALIQYQKARNVNPAQGYFGPRTRESMKSAALRGLWW